MRTCTNSFFAYACLVGVKLVLPVVLKGCEDKAWRTKQGSVQLLGAMRACAPQQLATALPTVVPRLAEVLADPHPKVQAAAKDALNQVGGGKKGEATCVCKCMMKWVICNG